MNLVIGTFERCYMPSASQSTLSYSSPCGDECPQSPSPDNVDYTSDALQPHAMLSVDEFSCIKSVIGISSPYNLLALSDHINKVINITLHCINKFKFCLLQRGLDKSILEWICNKNIGGYSPTLRVRALDSRALKAKSWRCCRCLNFFRSSQSSAPAPQSMSSATSSSNSFAKHFPRVVLYHGTEDVSVPAAICEEFRDALVAAGVQDVTQVMYNGYSHTDPILER